MDNNNLYKHIVDLYDNNPVTRKEYFTFLGVFSFYLSYLWLFSYPALIQ